MSTLKTQQLKKHVGMSTNHTQNAIATSSSVVHASHAQARPSLLQANNLSKVTGVSHLTEKSASQVIYLQKQPSQIVKKRDSKGATNDYYTVQNTRNPSTQQSVQQSSRNHTGIKNQSLITNNTVSASSNDPTPQQQQRQQQNGSNIGIINSFSHEMSIEKSQSHVQHSKNSHSSIRHSIHNHQSRAMSTSKSGQQTQFGQSASQNTLQNLVLKQKSSKGQQSINAPSIAYTDNSVRSYKKSMIQPQIQYSPKPGETSAKNANAIYRSPQQPKKTISNQAVISIINSSSPLPMSSYGKGAYSRISTANTDAQLKSHQRNNHSKVISKNANAQSTASCLQIDLSSLSTKNEDDIANSYGGLIHQSLQQVTSFHNQQHNNARKKQSISQNKKTPIQLTSQSPQIHSQFSAKSPKTFKQTSNRHSILNTFNVAHSNKAKQQTPKIFEASLNLQKNQTQKLSKDNKALSQKQQLNQDNKMSRLKSQEDIISNKNENYDNFSFTSNNQSPRQDLDYAVTDEKSNLNSNKQSLLQNLSQPNLLNQHHSAQVQSPFKSNNQSQERPLAVTRRKESYQEADKMPIKKQRFLEKHERKLLQFEIDEIRKMKDDRIYFYGQALEKSAAYLKMIKNKSEEDVKKNLDDEEGYYNVLLGDHLGYRYEIIKILGKGSFAQVVCCKDHKTGHRVAIKITRNTEIDHKFALSESKLLNFLMKHDTKDDNNIVRLINEFYFRDHHCFVFELLKSDLFEHLKENGFMGFETGKIRAYAIQMLKALMFLEKHNLIHCDLKPENILIADDACEKLKLVDYGSGCFKSEQVYTYVQSRFYRAPEVIMRIQYSEKVDMWSLGCIMAELYTGEPLFPGNNEQEQLELVMELCGIPPNDMIDKSRKKEHYFDFDYSPFLIEDEELGILRIPNSKSLEDVVNCQDSQFVDFIRCCLELDPELRFSAKQAMNHPWITEGLRSHAPPVLQQPTMIRRREEEQEGVKGGQYEESPVREIIDNKPKKSLTKHFNFQTVKVAGLEECNGDSSTSSPKDEGGIELKFQIMESEQVITEQEVNKPHSGSVLSKKAKASRGDTEKPQNVKVIGMYEIVRNDEDIRETNSRTSGIASEANIPQVNQHEIINNENTINKITVTFYQKRHQQKK